MDKIVVVGEICTDIFNYGNATRHKPKHGWKKHPEYWWTLSIKRGGAARRMDVLDRLAKGLSKGE